MGLSKYASRVHLPHISLGCDTVLDFLCVKFPAISAEIWRQRMLDGKVHGPSGDLIHPDTLFTPGLCVCYYREVEQEPLIPFQEQIVFQDEQILVAFKPHFLPVTPGGVYVDECLQNRLRRRTGIDDLQALHRLDRETAGLVLFSIKPDSRAAYHALFSERRIEKCYQAVAAVGVAAVEPEQVWCVENRMVKSEPRFLMKVVEGVANTRSLIRCLDRQGELALFELKPVSGKTHQLRVHMQSLGMPLLHDRFYPDLQPKGADDFDRPLQLLAKSLSFIDPLSGEKREFSCESSLALLV